MIWIKTFIIDQLFRATVALQNMKLLKSVVAGVNSSLPQVVVFVVVVVVDVVFMIIMKISSQEQLLGRTNTCLRCQNALLHFFCICMLTE